MRKVDFAKILLNGTALVLLIGACFAVSPYTGFAALGTVIFFSLIR